MPLIQNFSVAANNDTDINFDVGPDEGASLVGSIIYWRVYEQEFGLRVAGVPAILEKYTDNGLQVTDPDLGKFIIELDKEDTMNMLRNYFHEATIVDENGNTVTVTQGIMTVLNTELRL